MSTTKPKKRKPYVPKQEDVEPDWAHSCENCGAKPIIPITGMCECCTFGEAPGKDDY